MFIFSLSTSVEYAIIWRKHHLFIHSTVDGHWVVSVSVYYKGCDISAHISVVYVSRSGVAVPWGMLSFSRQCHAVFHSGDIPLNFPRSVFALLLLHIFTNTWYCQAFSNFLVYLIVWFFFLISLITNVAGCLFIYLWVIQKSCFILFFVLLILTQGFFCCCWILERVEGR